MHTRFFRALTTAGLGLALWSSPATVGAWPQAPAPQTAPATPAPPPQAPATPPQTPAPAPQPPPAPQPAAAAVQAGPGVEVPADYVIGPEDVLSVMYWRDKDMSADVTVRPDGQISLPLLNEVTASGLTPEQLRAKVTTLAAKFVEDPTVTIVVKAINSRKVFITGMVGRPGPYPLTGPTTVLQLIAMAGGVQEFADTKNITILRQEDGHQVAHPFNYKDVMKRKNLQQNIELKPGDTVIVP